MSIRPKHRKGDPLGDGLTALCGGALALNLVLVFALLWVLLVNAAGHFWQKELILFERIDAPPLLGEVHDREPIPAQSDSGVSPGDRVRIRVGNRELSGGDFVWLDLTTVTRESRPDDGVLLERLEWGNFYGTMVELRRGEEVLATGPDRVWSAFQAIHLEKQREFEALHRFEKGQIGDVNYRLERIHSAQRKLEFEQPDPETLGRRSEELDRRKETAEVEFEALTRQLFAMREEFVAETLVMEAADGTRKEMAVGEVVRAVQPNRIGTFSTLSLYASRIKEFLFDAPRESNTEGGIFPAIFGTVMMVFIMSFAVAPFGVLAALYLREYARQGFLVRVLRIAVNNLAGVPSIVFGMFGLGFLVYLIGGSIDQLFYPEVLPRPTFGTGGILWASLTLALLTVPVVIVATEEGLAAVPRIVREGSLALGATKFETTWRVVVPAAAPGILTGLILAMARAAGEVAPLMIVGMVKLAPSLPIDSHFPFFHLERKFMHLGFHIYDLGFQSPNVEATKPLVFATAFLLIAVVTVMNLLAIAVRNHLVNKYATSAV